MITINRIWKGLYYRIDRIWLMALNLSGSRSSHECNVCHRKTQRFVRYGGRESGCPYCGASDRERWVAYAMDSNLVPFRRTNCRTLHVAPSEKGVMRRLREVGPYVAGDLTPGNYRVDGIVPLDLTNLDGFGEFDFIYASHVLEHIPDDLCAMAQVYQHLSSKGAAWFLVPLHDRQTVDGHGAMTPSEREKQFGQWDHVRMYGLDLTERLEACGFSVLTIGPDAAPKEDVDRHGFNPEDIIFACKK